jgi:hypothetical protein
MVIVIVLPFLKFVVEQVDVIADAVLVEELLELTSLSTRSVASRNYCRGTSPLSFAPKKKSPHN